MKHVILRTREGDNGDIIEYLDNGAVIISAIQINEGVEYIIRIDNKYYHE